MESDIAENLRNLKNPKNWQKKSPYHWECDSYTISVCKTGDYRQYSAWFRNNMIGIKKTSGEAKNMCYEHNENKINAPNSA